jgi:hypothetical protein
MIGFVSTSVTLTSTDFRGALLRFRRGFQFLCPYREISKRIPNHYVMYMHVGPRDVGTVDPVTARLILPSWHVTAARGLWCNQPKSFCLLLTICNVPRYVSASNTIQLVTWINHIHVFWTRHAFLVYTLSSNEFNIGKIHFKAQRSGSLETLVRSFKSYLKHGT